jgi:hypothetical protein
MRYDVAPWPGNDQIQHLEVVRELLDAGLEPAGGLVNDLTPERNEQILRGYDDDARAQLQDGMGRTVPILLSADRVAAVEVSDLFGEPAVRIRTFLADGALVETDRRWSRVPPWPGRLAWFHRFASVDREMARAVAPRRTLVISDRGPAGQLDDHRRHVEAVSAARNTSVAPYLDLQQVADRWTASFAHEQSVARRSDLLIATALVVLVLVLAAVEPTGLLGGPWRLVAGPLLFLLVWWALSGLVVVVRRRITWRPAFPASASGKP